MSEMTTGQSGAGTGSRMGRHGTQAEEERSSPAARQRGGCRGHLSGEDCGTHCNWLARCLEPLLLWDKHLSVMEMRSQGDRTLGKKLGPASELQKADPSRLGLGREEREEGVGGGRTVGGRELGGGGFRSVCTEGMPAAPKGGCLADLHRAAPSLSPHWSLCPFHRCFLGHIQTQHW